MDDAFLTIRAALLQGRELLRSAGVTEPGLTAEVLLGHAMHRERVYFFAHPEQTLREVEWIHFGRYLHERMRGKPTQYITQKQEFYGRDFRVSPAVLIPRSETELLVETVLKLRENPAGVIDVGTGSGAIAVTLAIEGGHRVFAADLSADALRIAAHNADRLGAAVSFLQADLLTSFPDQSADVVVSNPPYVSVDDAPTLQREVRDFEPPLALFAGTTGLDIYRRLIPEAHRVLKRGGLLAMELGQGQGDALLALTAAWHNPQLFADLAGIPRVIVCEKP